MEKGKGKICKVTISGSSFEVPAGTRFLEIITARDKPGYQTLERSTVFLMMKAFSEFPDVEHRGHVIVDFSAGAGLFCRFSDMEEVPEELLKKVEKRMRELSEAAIPLKKSTIRTEDAIRLFREQGMTSKEKLFRFRRSSRVNIYELDGYKDYFYGYMVPDTSFVTLFSLKPYEKGFILKIPPMKDPSRLANVAVSRKVFRKLYDTTIQAEKLGLADVAGLNEYVAKGNARDLILSQEALMEKQIGDIAQKICSRQGVRFVMVAGPSSSGKTTFSNRLSTQLRAIGMKPHPVEVEQRHDKTAEWRDCGASHIQFPDGKTGVPRQPASSRRRGSSDPGGHPLPQRSLFLRASGREQDEDLHQLPDADEY